MTEAQKAQAAASSTFAHMQMQMPPGALIMAQAGAGGGPTHAPAPPPHMFFGGPLAYGQPPPVCVHVVLFFCHDCRCALFIDSCIAFL